MNQARLRVEQTSIRNARDGVARLHRHAKWSLSGKAAFVVSPVGGMPCGWALVGRPKSKVLQARGFYEITRVATDGTPNACSALYGAARRWILSQGKRVVTYTLEHEPGTSLRAAGFVRDGVTKKRSQWDTPARRRERRDGVIRGRKTRWVA